MRFLPIAFATLTLTACVSQVFTRHSTPAAVDPNAGSAYPLEIQYDLLGTGTAEACVEARIGQDPDQLAPYMAEEARYKAIESVKGADNLLYVRTATVRQDRRVCVTVTGRAYAIKHLHARPAEAFAPAPK